MITRSINSHIHSSSATREVGKDAAIEKNGYAEDKNAEPSPVDVHSMSDRGDEEIGIIDEQELQNAGLRSAFRFAAWSSIILVRGCGHERPFSICKDM